MGLFLFLIAVAAVILGWRLYWHLTIQKPAPGGSINIAIIGAPRFLNPVLNQVNEADRDLSAVIFSGLMAYNSRGELVNDLAEKYAVGDNGKIHEITLKENIKWHDGQALTADDVLFTVQTIQNPDFRSPLRALWQGIELEKINERAVRFRLKNAYPAFPNNLTFGLLPKHLWGNTAASQFALNELNLKPIGSGPYQFSKLHKDKNGTIKSITVKSFGGYFKSKPFINAINFYFYPSESDAFIAYKKDEADVFGFISAKNFADLKNKNNGDFNISAIALPRYFAAFFNQTQNKFLADKTVRQALALATDKKIIIDTFFAGLGQIAESPLMPGMTGYSGQIKSPNFSLEQAKDILSSAGWKDTDNDGFLEIGKNNEKLEIILTTIDWPELIQIAKTLKEQWNKIGVKVNLEIKEASKIQNDTIKPRQYQALLFGEVLGQEPDLFHFWHSSQAKDPGLNLALYSNLNADKLLAEAMEDMDKSSRAQKNQKIAEQIAGDLPAIFLFSPDYLMVARKDILGINLSVLDAPSSRFSQINQWHLKTQRVLK